MLLLFKRLFTELDVYFEVSAQRFRSVLKVFLVGLLCLSVVHGIATALVHGPTLLKSLTQVADTVVSWWPADQVAHWQNQRLTFSPAPTENKIINWPVTPPENITTHFAVYSPTTISEPDAQFVSGNQSALFVISPESFWLNQLNGEWSRTMPLSEAPGLNEVPTGDYDKTAFADLVGQAQAATRRAAISTLILWPFLSVLGSWLSNAWFVVIEASLVWLITRVMNWQLSWVRLAKLNCLLVIPATTLQYLGEWLYPDLTWSLFHITYWILLSALVLLGSKQLEKATL